MLGYAADSASSQYNFSGLKLDHGALNAADCCVAPITPVQRYFGMTELQVRRTHKLKHIQGSLL